MALPVEIAEFYGFIVNLWLLFPLMIRQVFTFCIVVSAVLAVLKMVRGGESDD